jgi:hypothetical protein
VRATPPRPSARRTGIPGDLDSLIAVTLAKDPNRRPSQPGTVANAYSQIVASFDPSRVSSRPLTRGATSSPLPRQAPAPNYTSHSGVPSEQPFTTRSPRRPGRTLLVALLTLGLVAAGGLAAFIYFGGALSGQPTAQVTFSEANDGRSGETNALQITADHLPNLSAGTEYDAWLIDLASEHVLPLGALTQDGQRYSVRFSGGAGNLIAAGDIIEITQEQPGVSVPVGKVMLRGAWPEKSLVHLRHVLTSFPATPGRIGLVTGVLTQSKLLSDHAPALRAGSGRDQLTMLCETQVMINLLEGQKGPEYQPVTPSCAARLTVAQGDGYGLIDASSSSSATEKTGYVPGALAHTSLGATAPDASTAFRGHAPPVEAALGNVQTWDTILLRDLVGLQRAPSDTRKVNEMVSLASNAYIGVDANNNGQIEATEGEGGAVTAYQQAQLMATLTLSPVKQG